MGEVLHLHVGDYGIGLSNALWSLHNAEHEIGFDFQPLNGKSPKGNPHILYKETLKQGFIPRVGFFDLGAEDLKRVWNDKNMSKLTTHRSIYSKETTGGNAACGLYTIGKEVLDKIMDFIRKEVEACENL